MEYLTAGEMAEKWNISSRRVTLLCNQSRVEGAVKKGLIKKQMLRIRLLKQVQRFLELEKSVNERIAKLFG